MGCVKIQENFPELTRLLSCDCRFTLPPRGYPSPVLFLLESELEHSQSSGFDAEKDVTDPKDKPAEPIQEDHMTILDFDKIFSSEADIDLPETSDDEWSAPDACDKDIDSNSPVALPAPEALLKISAESAEMLIHETNPEADRINHRLKSPEESVEIPITEEVLDEADERIRPETSVEDNQPQKHVAKDGCDPILLESVTHQMEGRQPLQTDWNQTAHVSPVWELVMELMKLRCQEEKLKAEIHAVVEKIDELVSLNSKDRIQAGFADIRKSVQATGKIQWVITIE